MHELGFYNAKSNQAKVMLREKKKIETDFTST